MLTAPQADTRSRFASKPTATVAECIRRHCKALVRLQHTAYGQNGRPYVEQRDFGLIKVLRLMRLYDRISITYSKVQGTGCRRISGLCRIIALSASLLSTSCAEPCSHRTHHICVSERSLEPTVLS